MTPELGSINVDQSLSEIMLAGSLLIEAALTSCGL